MLKGTLAFKARLPGSRLAIPRIELKPTHAALEKIELESDGNEITVTLHYASVATAEEADAVAAARVTAILDRVAFLHKLAIDRPSAGARQLVSVEPNALYVELGELRLDGRAVTSIIGLSADSAAKLKADLEQPLLRGERLFDTFRAALLAGTVEQFLHLYNLLLMLRNDGQADVDAFIRTQQPAVPQTPRPDKPHINETVYTRLRNEFGHKRAGVNLEETKKEMGHWLRELVTLTQRAIELYG